MCEWLLYWLVDCGRVWCARKRLGRGAGRGQRRKHTHLSSSWRTKVFTATAWMRMIWVETAWNDHHILTSPRILDSPELTIASGVVIYPRECCRGMLSRPKMVFLENCRFTPSIFQTIACRGSWWGYLGT